MISGKEKRWKPGQLITINNKVFRIKKANSMYTCTYCYFAYLGGGGLCYDYCISLSKKIPRNCYLEEVKPRV